MFTGIVQEVGMIQKKEKRKETLLLTIQSRTLITELKMGDSIAVNGACLTVEHLFKDAFKVAVSAESIAKTNLGVLHVSSRVNLEPPLRLQDRISGHLVSGHVDGTGKFLAPDEFFKTDGLESEGEDAKTGGLTNEACGRIAHADLYVTFPKELAPFLALKGSVTLNGVSLTVADLRKDTLGVALIPYTREHTNLGALQSGDIVNIEVDLIARYLETLLQGKEGEVRYEWLKERNFL